MPLALRLSLLRLTAMAGLCVSALLTYDKVYPDRAFCPLVEACNKAGESLLGSIGGVPTSVIGLGAFGALFLLTLVPTPGARRLMKVAGLLAALAGGVFFAYQALELEKFCPLCLVADAAGLLIGVLTLTWPRVTGRGRGRAGGESAGARVAWTLAAVLAVVLPFAWPRESRPAYIEIDPSAALADDEEVDLGTPPAVVAAVPSATPPAPPSRVPPGSRQGIPPPPTRPAPGAQPPGVPAAAPTPAPVRPPAPTSQSSPNTPNPPPTPTLAPPAPPKPEVTIVEYLNAYCPHCRATHARLEKVIAESGLRVRRRRVYTWASNDYPAWARACALAQSLGLEERMFEELLRSRGPDPREVQAAAQRAGLDPQALAAALRDPNPPPRLVKDRELFTQARLQGLPTLDIGRRRLMGEQSEGELRAALEAARALLAPATQPSR